MSGEVVPREALLVGPSSVKVVQGLDESVTARTPGRAIAGLSCPVFSNKFRNDSLPTGPSAGPVMSPLDSTELETLAIALAQSPPFKISPTAGNVDDIAAGGSRGMPRPAMVPHPPQDNKGVDASLAKEGVKAALAALGPIEPRFEASPRKAKHRAEMAHFERVQGLASLERRLDPPVHTGGSCQWSDGNAE